jgi:hypothetical protein
MRDVVAKPIVEDVKIRVRFVWFDDDNNKGIQALLLLLLLLLSRYDVMPRLLSLSSNSDVFTTRLVCV